MGTIQRSFDPELNLTIFTVKNHVDSKQIYEQILTFLKGEPTELVIWDFREGTLAGFTSNEMRIVIDTAMPLAKKRYGGRTAIVCPKDIDFGLARMFQIIAEIHHVPFEISVFRTIEAAPKWLHSSRDLWNNQHIN